MNKPQASRSAEDSVQSAISSSVKLKVFRQDDEKFDETPSQEQSPELKAGVEIPLDVPDEPIPEPAVHEEPKKKQKTGVIAISELDDESNDQSDPLVSAATPQATNEGQVENEEEISGFIDLPLLNKVIADNIVKLCSACCSPGEKVEHQWVMADTPGKSIRIELTPRRKAGRWVNHAAPPDEEKSKRGNFVQALMFLHNWTFPQAVAKIGLVVGVQLIKP